jgi:hypothetical protein
MGSAAIVPYRNERAESYVLILPRLAGAAGTLKLSTPLEREYLKSVTKNGRG